MSEINLPANINYLGERVFSGCNSLFTLNFNCIIECLPDATFHWCSSLKYIDLRNSNVKRIGAHSFSSCEKLEEISLPDSLEIIDHHAFAYCENLKSISIPESVKKVEWESFKDCTNLSSITILNGRISIDTLAFWGCSSLSQIIIPMGYRVKFEKMWPKLSNIILEQ